MNNKRKAGFSMVEVIISLAIIVMISITAISITLSSFANRMTIVNRTHAQYFADNVWECFKAAEKSSDFWDLVRFAHKNEVEEGSLTITDEDDDGVYDVASSKYQFKATVSVNFDIPRPELKVEVKELDDDEIISFTYEKGAK